MEKREVDNNEKNILGELFCVDAVSSGSSHPVAFCTTGQEVLNEIQNRYEKTNDFEASFIQEYIGKGMRQSSRGKGRSISRRRG